MQARIRQKRTHRCSLIKRINTTLSEQDATTDNLLTNAQALHN